MMPRILIRCQKFDRGVPTELTTDMIELDTLEINSLWAVPPAIGSCRSFQQATFSDALLRISRRAEVTAPKLFEKEA
jgi:hypothetical protein